MLLWIFLLFYSLVLAEVRPNSRCSADLSSCSSTTGTAFTKTTPPSVRRRSTQGWGDIAGSPKRRRPTRRRVSRKKIHRHSTRVLSLKPAVILLPPFESTPSEKAGLNPFIINVVEPTTTTARVDSGLQALPLEATTTTLPPPRRFLVPPQPDQRDNYVEQSAGEFGRTRGRSHRRKTTTTGFPYYMSSADTGLPYSTTTGFPQYMPSSTAVFPYYMPATTTTTAYPYFVQITNITDVSENPFSKLEKEYNEIQKVVEYDLTNRTYAETPAQYTQESISYENNTPAPSYNATPVTAQYTERWNDSFFEERQLRNHYGRQNTANSSLLAPEIASLGMKIVTSKKGMEMLKEFTIYANITAYPEEPSYDTNSGSINLETAETGDIRLQAYDNQILTFDETNELPKEALKALKKSRKPIQICSGRQGYVPDSASGCQIFYICLGRGAGEPMMCPNGTLFNQDFSVCDWWYNVECNE